MSVIRLRNALTFGASMLVIALLSACGPASPQQAAATSTPVPAAAPVATPQLSGKVTVFAAASLTDSFRTVATAFQKANPGVTVEFSFAASSALAAQIEQAAPADVFASADFANMEKITAKSLLAGEPQVFARNLPVIVVPADNRAGITAPRDLAKPGAKVVLAGPEVPIGNYARQIIDRLAADPANGVGFKEAVLRNVVSNEANVRSVLAKVELGEADAGIVYKTDALVAGSKVRAVAIPESANVIAAYPVGVLKAARNQEAAVAFVAFLVGAEGQQVLRAAAFDAAP